MEDEQKYTVKNAAAGRLVILDMPQKSFWEYFQSKFLRHFFDPQGWKTSILYGDYKITNWRGLNQGEKQY